MAKETQKVYLPLTISNIMEMKTEYVVLLVKENKDNGSVTMSVSSESWGPVVTGKDMQDAKNKMKEAFAVSMLFNTFMSHRKSLKDNFRTDMVDSANKMKELESQLQRF
ncbi:MAG: hypothetical protein KA802_18050 [Saprospiraceae bacterium]|nr:hypothetical protein [Bacteroidota bacterium]MBP7541829.1 hypothetical protein [Saprospiraceae bacterium]